MDTVNFFIYPNDNVQEDSEAIVFLEQDDWTLFD